MSDQPVSDRCACRGGMWKKPDGTWNCRACAKVETEEEHTASRLVLRDARTAHVRKAATEALKYAPKGEPGSVMLWATDVLEVFEQLDAANHRAELAEALTALAQAQTAYAWMEHRQKWPRSPNDASTPANDALQRQGLTQRLNDAQAAVAAIQAKGSKP